MIDKYFSWIDRWDWYNAFYVQVENFNYYTWMYHPSFTAPLMIGCLILSVWAFITFVGNKGAWLRISGAMLLYFILPPVLSALIYCWEMVLLLVIIYIIYKLTKRPKSDKSKKVDKVRQYKETLSINI